MSSKKTITVLGATGLQGGSVALKFLTDPELSTEWAVRAVTRDISKPAAEKLAEQGAQVVSANLDDTASLIEAISGSYAVFGVTNYWERADPDYETQQGKNLTDAVKATGVQHFIWSSLLNITELSKGKLPNVYHFDSKAKVEDYIRSLGVPATYFLAGFYMSNIAGGAPTDLLKPTPPDNAWTFTLPAEPNALIPLFHTGDTGKFVKAIVLHREEVLGKRFLGATAYVTAQEILDTFKKLYPEAGKAARYFQIPEEMFRAFMKSQGAPDHVISELYENVILFQEFGYYGGESLDETHKLVAEPLTGWEEYAQNIAEGFKVLK